MDLRRLALPPTLIAAACLALAGCGGGSGDSKDSSTGDAGSLQHVDGTLAAAGDGFTVTPKGKDPITFTAGPAVQPAALRALEASGAKAHVTYREQAGADPVAASVAAAPEIDASLASYEGQVKAVSSTSITLDGADGARTFRIEADDREAFDVAHIKEHKAEGSAIRVYYRPASGDYPAAAAAYEDAS
ncbi:MAG: hypothetical protein JWM98_1744 [Thermoleophilia bacterium]|nr:hypothetical protein [Thermoleophilia bacterium]